MGYYAIRSTNVKQMGWKKLDIQHRRRKQEMCTFSRIFPDDQQRHGWLWDQSVWDSKMSPLTSTLTMGTE
jgi:hypothetical protein